MTGGVRRQTDVNTVVPGHEYGYGFDAIGNRTTTTVNGRAATYTPNMRNQYEQRTVPGSVDVLGVALPGALVLANGVEAVRQGGNFAATVTVNNATAQHPSLNIKAVAPGFPGSPDVQAEDRGRVFISATPEIFIHDEDGNLTGDGRWTYEWDAEDRLRAMVTRTDLPATVPRLRLEFTYDARSRRIEKKVKTWNAGTTSYVLSQWIKYVYDEGWNLVAEVDGNNAVIRKYMWGMDLSQSRQGAGGVAGLLVETSGSADYLTCYDGNGNITGLIKADDGQRLATYAFGPFGEPLRATGAMAASNPFPFSTKYQDQETGLLYYGFRYYQPTTGRWLSRDPIEESGGSNLNGFVYNNPIKWIDDTGRAPFVAGNPTPYPPFIPPGGFPPPPAGTKHETKGNWTFDITDGRTASRDVVEVSYKMTEKQKKCCDSFKIVRRATQGLFRNNTPDGEGAPTPNFMTGYAEPDQPGGILGAPQWVPSVPHTTTFNYDAECTRGYGKNGVLSQLEIKVRLSGYDASFVP